MTNQLARALADRYTIERELGAGGMATVYSAVDLKHHRSVAIKVLRPELAAALGAERFLKEIETTANLRHPHILPLYDPDAFAGRFSALFDGLAVQVVTGSHRRTPQSALRACLDAAGLELGTAGSAG